jgi:hypothetical protein
MPDAHKKVSPMPDAHYRSHQSSGSGLIDITYELLAYLVSSGLRMLTRTFLSQVGVEGRDHACS